MLCAECGYVMTDFDITCRRCQGKGLPGTAKPVSGSHPANAATPKSTPVQTAEHEKQTSDPTASWPLIGTGAKHDLTGAPAAMAPVAPAVIAPAPVVVQAPVSASAPQWHPSMGCPNCRSDNIQRVSSILRSGTWSESSAWSEKTRIDAQTTGGSIGVAWGEKHATPITTISSGHTGGTGYTNGSNSTRGATELARLLAGAPCPTPPVREVVTEKMFMWFFMTPIMIGAFMGSGVAAVVLLVLSMGLLILIWQGNNDKYKQDTARHNEAVSGWHQKCAARDKLFYCHRCDRLFSPETGQSVESTQMYQLL